MVDAFKNILIEIKDKETQFNDPLVFLIEILGIKKITFYYIYQHNNEIIADNQALEAYSDKDLLQKELKVFIERNITEHHSVQYEIIFIQNNSDHVKSLLRTAIQKDIDLIIFEYGRNTATREEILKISKYSYCSVIVFPEPGPGNTFEKLLIPLDFSEYSRKALNVALNIAESRKVQLVFNHVYYVSSGYHATGKSYEESANLEKQAAKKEIQEFMSGYDFFNTNISYSFILDDDKDPTDKIYKDAVDKEIDLIIIGAKGKRNLLKF